MKRILIATGVLALAACSPDPGTAPTAPPAAEAAAAPRHKDPLLSAVGIGVSDLAKSTDFYVNVMGMENIRTIKIDYMDEEILRYPDGESYLVLMHWTDGSARNAKDLSIKIVTRVKDPVALGAKIKAAGYEVTREPQPSAGRRGDRWLCEGSGRLHAGVAIAPPACIRSASTELRDTTCA